MVAKSAAENLIPCILELGGKSPTVVDEDADIESASTRIAHFKLMNCGQTCVAPDYLFVHKSIYDNFLAKLIEKIKQFYGDNAQLSKDYPRIINQFHVNRLKGLMDSNDHNGKIIYGNLPLFNPRRNNRRKRPLHPTNFNRKTLARLKSNARGNIRAFTPDFPLRKSC